MDKWILINKFILILFCALEYSKGNMKDVILIITLMLIYLSINAVAYIFKNKAVRAVILTASFLMFGVCGFTIFSLFVILLPVNIFELVDIFKFPWTYAISFTIIPVFFIKGDLFNSYILTTSLSGCIYYLLRNLYSKVMDLIIENDDLRKKNYDLFIKIDRNDEYKKDLKYLSQLEERNKIAQEIHDSIGHTISGSLMQLEAAKLLVYKDTDRAAGIIVNVIGILRNGMESIRITLRNIKPQSEEIGINRLKVLIDEKLSNSNVRSSLVYKGNLLEIPYFYWKVIYENVKEALTNVLKYSNASNVRVNIEVLNKFIKVEVKDNGRGSDKITKGLGILGIEERTHELGGKVIIDGSDGFTIITLLPKEVNK
ncbi:histidine kinase [Fervidicella metallireducens AeB]|uniref:histidine kinase n=1 Tax=Fervidicella metallireducens AeB TaxID=1403537 RepID=A0A017RTM4_9CLOT|nr:sensor histidine kinase [Fervidicella metallireducens]EYE88078.1 histidine kinase [Fervidicella metallireducens AeB]